MEKEITEIEQDLFIDKNNLDFECIDQPKRFLKWSQKMSQAIKERDQSKRAMVVTRAVRNSDIRFRPSEYGVEKVTEGSIAATLENQGDVQAAEQLIIDNQYAVNIFTGAKEAFEQRKSMLEKLVNLYISGYYSRPKTEGEGMSQITDIGTEEIKTALRLRIKKGQE